MSRTERLPQLIAILRTPEDREPFIQVLRTTFRRGQYQPDRDLPIEEDHYTIEDCQPPNGHSSYRIEELGQSVMARGLHKILCKSTESHYSIEVYYWYLPFAIYSGVNRIPLVEFQHRSWIPRGRFPVRIGENYDIPSVVSIANHIQRERLEEIRGREDEGITRDLESRGYWNNPLNRRILRRPGRNIAVDIEEIRESVRRIREREQNPPQPPPQPEVRIVEVTVPVERIIIRTVVQPLPKSVADLILSTARKGTESCPITQTPYNECEKICVSSCFHIFDNESLARWRENHSSCPVCRAEIQNVVSE